MFERLTIKTDICIEPENEIVYHNPNDPEGMYNIMDLAECLYSGGEAEAGILMEISRRLAAYEDSGLSPEEITEKIVDLENKISDLKATLEIYRGFDGCRLNQLIDADMDGRLVVLPCKVGSDLWSIERARTKCTAHGEEFSEYSCQGCEEPCDSVITQKIRRVKEASHMTIAHFMQSDCFGKTVFLTKEAAEKALEPEKQGSRPIKHQFYYTQKWNKLQERAGFYDR